MIVQIFHSRFYMENKMIPEMPFELTNMMQGLAYWIGHRHSLYAGHELPEAALVVEASNLVYARLKNEYTIMNEIEYNKLTKTKSIEVFKNHARADMIVLTKPRKSKQKKISNYHRLVKMVIEFKRSGSSLINNDLLRLAEIKRLNNEIRAFLIVVSESKKPKKYVTSEGKAKLGIKAIPKSDFVYKIRRVCKAAESFNIQKSKSTHYVCALEVIQIY